MSNPHVAYPAPWYAPNDFQQIADAHPVRGVAHHVRMAVAELLLFLAQMLVTRRTEEGARLTRFVADYFRECARAESRGGHAGGAKIPRASFHDAPRAYRRMENVRPHMN